MLLVPVILGLGLTVVGGMLAPAVLSPTQVIYVEISALSLVVSSVLLVSRLPRLAVLLFAVWLLLIQFVRQYAGSRAVGDLGLNRWADLLVPLGGQCLVLGLVLWVRQLQVNKMRPMVVALIFVVTLLMALIIPGLGVPLALGEPLGNHRVVALPLEASLVYDAPSDDDALVISIPNEGVFASVVAGSDRTTLRQWKLRGIPIGGRLNHDRVRLVVAEPGAGGNVTLVLAETTSFSASKETSLQCGRTPVPSLLTNCLSPDGDVIALNGGLVVTFDQPSLSSETVEPGPVSELLFVEWRPDSAHAVFYNKAKNQLLLKSRDSRTDTVYQLESAPREAFSVALSPAGDHVAFSVGEDTLVVRDLLSGEEAVMRFPKALLPRVCDRLVWHGDTEIVYVAERNTLCAVDVDRRSPGLPRYLSPIYDSVFNVNSSRDSTRLFWTTCYPKYLGLHED